MSHRTPASPKRANNDLLDGPVVVAVPRLPLTAIAALALLASVDLPRLVNLGGQSLSALITVGLALTFILMLPATMLARHRNDLVLQSTGRTAPVDKESFLRVTWRTLPIAFAVFLAWCVASLSVNPSVFGVQNSTVYLAAFLSIPLSAHLSSSGTSERFLALASAIAVGASLTFIASSLAGIEIYGERGFAAVALIYLAILVPRNPSNLLMRAAPYVVTAAIVVSLSRTAAVIAMGMLVFMAVRSRRGRRLWRALLLLAILSVLSIAVVWSYQPFRDRFFGGDNAIQLGSGLTFNTSGRDRIWSLVLSSWQEQAWFGHGVGSAQELVTTVLGDIAHPHNEYLRLLHDFGVIGLTIFLLGALSLGLSVFRRALRTGDPIHWSALLALTSVLALAITDNPLVYVFVMVPTGVLLGLSIASTTKRPAGQHRPLRAPR